MVRIAATLGIMTSGQGYLKVKQPSRSLAMPIHDIIDNCNEKLVDHMNRILASIEAARFAVFRNKVRT
jgi:hypothetical protein